MSCLACDLTTGEARQPGGTLLATDHWVIAHCVGPLGLGSLIVKPTRHVTSMAELTDPEAQELGPLLRRAARASRDLVDAEQVYVCLWSHAGAVAGHIHYVVQPVTHAQVTETGAYGPALQMRMFTEAATPSDEDIENVAPQLQQLL